MTKNTDVRSLCFDKICRTCLSEGDMQSIFSEINNENMKIIDMLTLCTSIKVLENDNLPLQICTSCLNEMRNFYKFRKKCENAENTLQRYITCTNLDMEEMNNCDNKPDKNANKVARKPCERQTDTNIKYETVKCTNVKEDKCAEIDYSLRENRQGNKVKKKFINKKDVALSYQCKLCPDVFENAEKLSEHKKTFKHPLKRDHKCTVCSKSFTYSHLKIHMRSHTQEKPYSCQICGQGFTLNCNLQRHLLIHSGTKPFKCNVCEKAFTQNSTLSQHLQTHNERDKSYLCSDCGRGFSCLAGLRSHSKIHTGIRPYPCSICSKSFTHIGTLKSHILIHTGQRPFACDVCNRSFTQRNHLRYHLRIHSGERPFQCNICEKTFSLKGNLTVHMRTHTGETPYHCPVCDKGFYDSSSMKKHAKGHSTKQGNT